jgi:hypothetical protein
LPDLLDVTGILRTLLFCNIVCARRSLLLTMESGDVSSHPIPLFALAPLTKASRMNALPVLRSIALAVGVLCDIAIFNAAAAAQEAPCALEPPCPVYIRQATVVAPEPAAPSWIFRHSTYTHDPYTGARVAQYMPLPAIEPLDDQRLVTSRYRRSRTNLRGSDGSSDTYYEVQQWGNGRGGLDAEWERFHDAWKESYLSGGYYNQSPYGNASPYGGPFYGGGYGYGGPGYGGPGYGGPGYGFPGFGMPGYGMPVYGGPGYGGAPGGGPPQGGSHHSHND